MNIFGSKNKFKEREIVDMIFIADA